MTALTKTPLIASIEQAAQQAGLALQSATAGTGTTGAPTVSFQLGLPGAPDRSLQLELSESFAFDKPELLPELTAHLASQAKRLRNPRPECTVTLDGLPLSFGKFEWPCHRSTSGADTFIVHGQIDLADGGTHNLHAKVAAAITVTFAEIVPAMEQPYAEDFVYNAIRKTVDLGQLEFLKSGNRQPVPVTTRFYSRWKKAFNFTDTTSEQQLEFILRKIYWLSGVLGNSQPVWIADPVDAQYLNTSGHELLRVARESGTGLITFDGEYAAATPKLLALAPKYQADLEAALNFTKPQFNEAMRAGQANM